MKTYTLLRLENADEIPDGKFIGNPGRAECDGLVGTVRTYEVSPNEAYEQFSYNDGSLIIWFKFVEVA